MIKYNDVFDILSSTGIHTFANVEEMMDEEFEQNFPYVAFNVIDSYPFYADNIVYMTMLKVQIELVCDHLDFESQVKIEQALSDNYVVFNKSYDYDEDNRINVIGYEITVMQ